MRSRSARWSADFREAVDDAAALVLIDQEGGRVQRLMPPDWRRYPAGRRFGALHASDRRQRA